MSLKGYHVHYKNPLSKSSQHEAYIIRPAKSAHQLHIHFVDCSKSCNNFAPHHMCHRYIVEKIWVVIFKQGVMDRFNDNFCHLILRGKDHTYNGPTVHVLLLISLIIYLIITDKSSGQGVTIASKGKALYTLTDYNITIYIHIRTSPQS